MTIKTWIQSLMSTSTQTAKASAQYLFDGVLRIFKATDDNYPETGAQPFDGEIPKCKNGFS